MTNEHWLVTTATINSCAWEDPPSQTPSSLFVGHFTVSLSYAIDGNRYCSKFHSSHAWEKEAEVEILYNPKNPMESSVCDEGESQIVPVLECALELLGELLP
jgi:hypothetical protein